MVIWLCAVINESAYLLKCELATSYAEKLHLIHFNFKNTQHLQHATLLMDLNMFHGVLSSSIIRRCGDD